MLRISQTVLAVWLILCVHPAFADFAGVCPPNTVVAGPPNGTANVTSCRAIVGADLPLPPPQGYQNTILSVTALGADSSGTSDVTAIIQTAVNNACSGSGPASLFFPPGTYKVASGTGVLVPCAGLDIFGAYGRVTINYSGATAAFTFQPIGWPAVTRRNMPVGNKIRNLIFSTTIANNSRALEMDGQTGCVIDNVQLTGSQSYNGIRLYGDYKCSISNVTTGYFISPQNTFIEILGDLTGVCDPALGGPCTSPTFACNLGNCSTRTDVTHLVNVDSSGNNGDGILLHNMTFDTVGGNIQIENRSYGLRTQCDAGFPNINYCPQEINFTDFESEGATIRPINLIDGMTFHCVECYVLGQGDIDINLDTANYTGETGFSWKGGKIFGATSACVFVRRWANVSITGAIIYDCNTGAVGQAGVSLSDTVSMTTLANNQFCTYQGSAPSSMIGVILSATDSAVNIADNLYTGCGTSVSIANGANNLTITGNDFSQASASITWAPSGTEKALIQANLGMPAATITSGFGTSPAISGNGSAGRVTVGSGGASSGVVALNTISVTQPVCSAQDETTSNPMRASVSSGSLTITGTMVAADKVTYSCTPM